MSAAVEGTIVRIDARRVQVRVGGDTIPCRPRGVLFHRLEEGKAAPFAVGDRVRIVRERGEGSIEAVLPRRTKLSRESVAPGKPEQVIVANVDLLVVVASLARPELRLDTVDAYLAAAESGGLEAAVLFHKVDLVPRELVEELSSAYERIGYRAILSSSVTGEGIDDLRALLRDRITVFAGHSGVGKSSLVNAVDPQHHLKTGDVSKMDEGTHTTSAVSLLPLAGGGAVVDTPGVREFGLFAIRSADLKHHFREFEARAPACRFRRCDHLQEPGCAVVAAIDAGEIAQSRHDSYRVLRVKLLKAEAAWVERQAFRARKARRPRAVEPPPLDDRDRTEGRRGWTPEDAV